MRNFLCLVLGFGFIATFPAFAQQAQLRLHLQDEAFRPVKATVEVQAEGKPAAYRTNAQGHVRIRYAASADSLRVTVRALGYRDTVLVLRPPYPRTKYIKLQNADLFTETVVVSAGRGREQAAQSPIRVETLENDLFRATQSLSLAEGLSYSPALRVENNCQNCGFTQVRMNGLPGPYTQVLIDNRPVFSALNGVYGLEQLPPEMIERVEVVRGGGSSLYGNNAIAGTINLITRQPDQNAWGVGGSYRWIGNSATPDRNFSAYGSLSTPQKDAGVALYGFRRDRAAYDHNNDQISDLVKLENLSGGLSGFWAPRKRLRINYRAMAISEYRRGGTEINNTAPHQTALAEELTHRTVNGGLDVEWFSPGFRHKIAAYTAATATDRQSYYGAGFDPDAYGQTDDQQWVGGLQYAWQPAAPFRLLLGSEWIENRVRDEMPGYQRLIDQTARNWGTYLQARWEPLQRLQLLAGARLDQHNLLREPAFNPRVALRYGLHENLWLRGSYATGFRAPQAFDEDLHIGLVGGEAQLIRLSEALAPEFSNSATAELGWAPPLGGGVLNLSGTGFFTRLQDAFVLQETAPEPDGTQVLLKTNGDGGRVYGGTLQANWQHPAGHQFLLNFTLQEARYDAPVFWSNATDPERAEALATDQFLRAPDAYGSWLLRWAWSKRFSTTASGIVTGPMQVPHFAGAIARDRLVTSPWMPEVNLRLAYTLPLAQKLELEIFAGVNNLTNSFQDDLDTGLNRDVGYLYGPLLPRNYFAGLRLRSQQP